ncbi:hypothetical protein D3C87_2203600 [compost metagenome]
MGHGIDDVMGTETRHAPRRQRGDIADIVDHHFEVRQIDLQDFGGNAGRVA